MNRPELLDVDPATAGIPQTLAAVHKLLFADREEARRGKLTRGHQLVDSKLRELVLQTDTTTPSAHFEALARTTFACASIFRQISDKAADVADNLIADYRARSLAAIAVCMAPQGSELQRKLSQRLSRDFN